MYVLNRGGPESVGRLEHKRVCVCTVDEGYVGEWGTGGIEGWAVLVAQRHRPRCRRPDFRYRRGAATGQHI